MVSAAQVKRKMYNGRPKARWEFEGNFFLLLSARQRNRTSSPPTRPSAFVRDRRVKRACLNLYPLLQRVGPQMRITLVTAVASAENHSAGRIDNAAQIKGVVESYQARRGGEQAAVLPEFDEIRSRSRPSSKLLSWETEG